MLIIETSYLSNRCLRLRPHLIRSRTPSYPGHKSPKMTFWITTWTWERMMTMNNPGTATPFKRKTCPNSSILTGIKAQGTKEPRCLDSLLSNDTRPERHLTLSKLTTYRTLTSMLTSPSARQTGPSASTNSTRSPSWSRPEDQARTRSEPTTTGTSIR